VKVLITMVEMVDMVHVQYLGVGGDGMDLRRNIYDLYLYKSWLATKIKTADIYFHHSYLIFWHRS
jgi:hypothetical protein